MDYEVLLSPSGNSTFSNLSHSCQFYRDSETWLEDIIETKFCWKHNFQLTFLFLVLYSLIFICGLVGNSLVIWVVLSKPKMRTVTNLFLLNLAVADLFVILFCVPVTLLTNLFIHFFLLCTAYFLTIAWILGEFMCKAVPYIQGVSVFSSAYSLVAISVDRCWAIHHPMGLLRGLSKSQAHTFIVLIWISALAITLPWWFVFHLVSLPGPIPFCNESWLNPAFDRSYFFSVHLIGYFTLPVLLTIILNGIVWHNVNSRPIIARNSSSSTVLNSVYLLHRKTKLRVLKMLSILTLVFFFSWLPVYGIMTRLKFFGHPNKTKSPGDFYMFQVLIPIAQLLGSANSSLNPILYAFLNKKFRLTLNSLVATCFARFSKQAPTQGRMPLVSINDTLRNRAHKKCANGRHQVHVQTTLNLVRGRINSSSLNSTNTVQTHTECTNS